MPREITGVAYIHRGVIWSLPRPARHGHLIRAITDATRDCVGDDSISGFVDDLGRFLTREQAFQITGKGRGGESYSEDLWDTPEPTQDYLNSIGES